MSFCQDGGASLCGASPRRGMVIFMQDFARGFYKSKSWQRCRAGFIQMKGGLCEDCLKQGLVVPGEIVHHKTPITQANINDPAITLNYANLQLLCRQCHAKQHADSSCKRYKVMADGSIVCVR